MMPFEEILEPHSNRNQHRKDLHATSTCVGVDGHREGGQKITRNVLVVTHVDRYCHSPFSRSFATRCAFPSGLRTACARNRSNIFESRARSRKSVLGWHLHECLGLGFQTVHGSHRGPQRPWSTAKRVFQEL